MRESTTYMGIIEEGRIEEAQRIILRQGKKRFGKPSAAVQSAIQGLASIERLERLTDRLLEVSSWKELLEMA